MIRFVLDFQGVGAFDIDPTSAVEAGWYIDNIKFIDIEEIGSVSEVAATSGSSSNFTPASVGTYRLSARADLLGGALPYGDSMDIVVVSSGLTDWLASNPQATGGNAGDPDLDGINNLIEYAFGLNPSLNDIGSLPRATSSATQITYSASRPAYDHGDITYAIERSSTLKSGSWTTVKTFSSAEALSYSESFAPTVPYFYRWKITLNP